MTTPTLREAAQSVVDTKDWQGLYFALADLRAALATPEPDVSAMLADLARANARAEAWKKAMLSVSWHSASCDCPLCVNAQAALAAARRLEEGK